MNHNKEKKYAVLIGEIIVNKCLDRNLEINTSKLMKLLYYMQKLHLQKYGETMFSDEIVATINGPYVDSVATYFIEGRLGFKTKCQKRIVLFDSHEDVVNTVLEKYGNISPIDLMKLSMDDHLFKSFWTSGKRDKRVIPFDNFETTKESPKTLKYIKN